jgi:hypothetical protein
MREAIFADKRQAVALIARDIVLLIREEGVGLDPAQRRAAEATVERMIGRFAYCRVCASDIANLLVRRRFHDLIV